MPRGDGPGVQRPSKPDRAEHRPPPPRAAGPIGPARGRGSARGLHGAPRARPPFPGRHPAGRDRLAQARRFHALLGDLHPPPPRPAGRSEPQAGSAAPAGPATRQEPPGPHAHGRRARPVPSQARGASPAQPRSAPRPRGHPAPLPAGPHREPPPPRVSRIEAARVTRMFPLPLLCLHSGVSLPLASARSATALFCPSARPVCDPIVTPYASSPHRSQRCPQQCLSRKYRRKPTRGYPKADRFLVPLAPTGSAEKLS